MKKLWIGLALLGALGCNCEPPKKPFTIVGKEICCGHDYATYHYTDVNGKCGQFDDKKDYVIGQIIN